MWNSKVLHGHTDLLATLELDSHFSVLCSVMCSLKVHEKPNNSENNRNRE